MDDTNQRCKLDHKTYIIFRREKNEMLISRNETQQDGLEDNGVDRERIRTSATEIRQKIRQKLWCACRTQLSRRIHSAAS